MGGSAWFWCGEWGQGKSLPWLTQSLQLPLSLYKKVLVAMHDSILPHLAQPTLMIDFLTSACDVGKWDFHLGCLARARLQLQTVTDWT